MIPIKLKSNFCLTPNQCYQVETEIPAWMLVLLVGSSLFLLKEIYNSFN